MRPALLASADWGSRPGKRWIAKARLEPDGCYSLEAPEPVGDVDSLLERLRAEARSCGAAVVGFDFPIGLAARYAERAGVHRFLDLLPKLGAREWSEFYDVASTPEEIALRRPFYPARPGFARQRHLVEALGVEKIDDLLRRCERSRPGRRAAAPLFWTLGGQQVGKAAIVGWRDVLGPALRSRSGSVAIWPFSGPLEVLGCAGGVIVVETYPAEYCAQLGVDFPAPGRGARGGKRAQSERARNAPLLLGHARRCGHRLPRGLEDEIRTGFGSGPDGEDRFDAFLGLLGMLRAFERSRGPEEPTEPEVRAVEGWILGQSG